MVHQSLTKLLKDALDNHPTLSKQIKSQIKRELDNLPECVSFQTRLRIVEDYTGPLIETGILKGKGDDPSYKIQACGSQTYCDTLRELGRCNGSECFFSNHY